MHPSPVLGILAACQKALAHQHLHRLGHIALGQPPQSHDVPGGIPAGVVVQKDQNVEFHLRNAHPAANCPALGIIKAGDYPQAVHKLHVVVHSPSPLSFLFAQQIVCFYNYLPLYSFSPTSQHPRATGTLRSSARGCLLFILALVCAGAGKTATLPAGTVLPRLLQPAARLAEKSPPPAGHPPQHR